MKKPFVLFLFVIFSFPVFSQNMENRSFEFSIRTKDVKWKQMSIFERIQALQIPEDIIHGIPTSELLETCLDFPYLIDILFSDNLQSGFVELTIEFNGFRELLCRKDLTETVLTKNNSLPYEIARDYGGIYEKGIFSIKWLVFEMILTQDSVLSCMDKDSIDMLLSSSKENIKIKNDNPSIFSSLNTIPTYLLFAKHIMKDEAFRLFGKEDKHIITRFVENPVGVPDSVIPLIMKYIGSNY